MANDLFTDLSADDLRQMQELALALRTPGAPVTAPRSLISKIESNVELAANEALESVRERESATGSETQVLLFR
jgi:hypothetical protein